MLSTWSVDVQDTFIAPTDPNITELLVCSHEHSNFLYNVTNFVQRTTSTFLMQLGLDLAYFNIMK